MAKEKRKYEANRENVNSLHADLNAAIDTYELAYASSNKLWFEALNDDMKAGDNFVEAVETERKRLEDADYADDDEHNVMTQNLRRMTITDHLYVYSV